MAIERGFRAKLRYRIDEFIGGGAGKHHCYRAIFTGTRVVAFTRVGLVFGLGVEDGFAGNVFERVYEVGWFSFGRVIDSGTFTADSGMGNRVVSTIAAILGV